MKKIVFGAFSALVLLSACNKDDNNDNVAPASTTLNVNFNYEFDGSEFVLGDTYMIPGSSNTVEINTANFYVANLSFANMDGDAIVPGDIEQHYLVTPANATLELGTVNASHIHTMTFEIGVDSLVNHTVQPSDISDMNDPLAAQVPSMYWTWNSGYIFLRVEGMIDTDGDGTVDTPFEYHVGMDAFRRSFSAMVHSDLTTGALNTINLNIDVAAVFQGLDPAVDFSTHTMDNMMLAAEVANNWAAAITLE